MILLVSMRPPPSSSVCLRGDGCMDPGTERPRSPVREPGGGLPSGARDNKAEQGLGLRSDPHTSNKPLKAACSQPALSLHPPAALPRSQTGGENRGPPRTHKGPGGGPERGFLQHPGREERAFAGEDQEEGSVCLSVSVCVSVCVFCLSVCVSCVFCVSVSVCEVCAACGASNTQSVRQADHGGRVDPAPGADLRPAAGHEAVRSRAAAAAARPLLLHQPRPERALRRGRGFDSPQSQVTVGLNEEGEEVSEEAAEVLEEVPGVLEEVFMALKQIVELL
ncbi:hypothetical protein L3Q82_018407 [Scortum barcoo]|uniref:Uncharacterized protein n=1 Tax=Scortum barcoo TaxID=214431 RepID=A0ACB8VJ05_9TELE|nr:hypothetical protein L3Q82_018407 [Scortum barcoo]